MNSTADKIGEIIPPSAVAYSLDTLGWKIVGGLLVLLCIVILILWVKHYNKNRYRKEALQLLSEINAGHVTSANIYAIDKLLRRTAFTAYNQQEIKQMMYSDWKMYLDSKIKNTSFSEQDFNTILKGIYDENSIVNAAQQYKSYYQYAEFWIRKHAL